MNCYARSRRYGLILSAAIVASAISADATVYNPFAYNSLGTLNATLDTLTINTTTATITDQSVFGTTQTYTGFIDNQGGAPGAPSVAVFDFSDLAIFASTNLVLTGNNGLVLLSRSNVAINQPIILSGVAGSDGSTGSSAATPGGAGGMGGFHGGSGGQPDLGFLYGGGGTGSTSGAGPGGAGNAGPNGLYMSDSGGGGGFGGAGGTALGGANLDNSFNPSGGAGGAVYGSINLGAQTTLYGGSGGGGGNYINGQGTDNSPNGTSSGGGGGGGGGALEIVAAGSIQLNAAVNVAGGTGGFGGGSAGAGGGGSGGEIILVGSSVSAPGGISAAGGNSQVDSTSQGEDLSGSGGGGRILIESPSTPVGSFSVSAGVPQAPFSNAGQHGTLSEFTSGLSTPSFSLIARRGGGAVSQTISLTNTGTAPGNVVFGQVQSTPSISNVAGLPSVGSTFTLDPFHASQNYTLTYSPAAGDTTQTGNISIASTVGSFNIPITTQAVGPQFNTNYGTGGVINFGNVDVGTVLPLQLDFSNTSTDAGSQSLTELTITGYQALTYRGAKLALTGDFWLTTLGNVLVGPVIGPIDEGYQSMYALNFSPHATGPVNDVLRIFTDQGGPAGLTNSYFDFPVTGTGAPLLLGDANYDGIVNTTDEAILVIGTIEPPIAGAATWSEGDFNQDGVINQDDWALFQLGLAQYDATLQSAPEPTATIILAGGVIIASRRRRDIGQTESNG